MRARVGVVVSGVLLLAAVGCGGDDGGGGDLEAFCDELEAFSEDIADGDLASSRGLESLVERVNELNELAGDEQVDAVGEVGQLLADSDTRPEDAADVAETIQDELGDLAEECDIDDFAAFEPDGGEDDETTTTAPEEGDTTTVPDETTPPDGGLNVVSGRTDPATLAIDAGFEESVDQCFRGLMVACDDIFFGENGLTPAPDGSDTRLYGETCGGRILDFNTQPQRCVDNLFAASEFDPATFTDASFVDLANACKGDETTPGDMQACDDLFIGTGVGTVEEAYGNSCGGRIDTSVAERQTGSSCVSIWGPTAEFG